LRPPTAHSPGRAEVLQPLPKVFFTPISPPEVSIFFRTLSGVANQVLVAHRVGHAGQLFQLAMSSASSASPGCLAGVLDHRGRLFDSVSAVCRLFWTMAGNCSLMLFPAMSPSSRNAGWSRMSLSIPADHGEKNHRHAKADPFNILGLRKREMSRSE